MVWPSRITRPGGAAHTNVPPHSIVMAHVCQAQRGWSGSDGLSTVAPWWPQYLPLVQRVQNPFYEVLYFIGLQRAFGVAPGLAIGLTDRLWAIADVVALIDAQAKELRARGPYRPQVRFRVLRGSLRYC